jgi:hypothetical protein
MKPTLSFLVALILFAGCDRSSGNTAAGAKVRDSAGIAIVDNSPAPAALEVAVESLPAFTIGGGVGGADYDLNEIRGSVRLSDGRIVVADNLSGELRFFDSAGTFLLRGGRKGQGPGEFEQIIGMWPLDGDTVAVFDAATRRLSFFSPDGSFARQVDLATAGFVAPTGLLSDGTIVGSGFSFNPDSMPAKGTRRRNVLPILLISPDGAHTDTMAPLEGMEIYTIEANFGGRTFPTPMQVQFGMNTTVAGWGDEIYIGDNARSEIRVHGRDGTLKRIIRSPYTPVSVTEADRTAQEEQNIERWQANPLRGMPKDMMDQVEGWIREAIYADRFPAFETFLLDRIGNIWVQDYGPGKPQQYRVYSPTGEFVVRTALPADVRPLEIGRNYLLGIWKDGDGLEHVRLYRTPALSQETARSN